MGSSGVWTDWDLGGKAGARDRQEVLGTEEPPWMCPGGFQRCAPSRKPGRLPGRSHASLVGDISETVGQQHTARPGVCCPSS